MTTPSVRDVLVAARKLIRKGWCQNRNRAVGRGGNEQLCIVEAVIVAAPAMTLRDYSLGALERCARVTRLVNWNDNPRRRKRDVLALLDKTIKETAK